MGYKKDEATRGKPTSFWTACSSCNMSFEYVIKCLGKKVRCQNCKISFFAVEIERPQSDYHSPSPWSAFKYESFHDKSSEKTHNTGSSSKRPLIPSSLKEEVDLQQRKVRKAIPSKVSSKAKEAGKRYKTPLEVRNFAKLSKSIPKGESISFKYDPSIFGYDLESYFGREDMDTVIKMTELLGPCISIYISYLYMSFLKDKENSFGFMHPDSVSRAAHIDSKQSNDIRSNYIMERLKAADGKLKILMPYNTDNHWILLVLDYKTKTIYYLDPLRKAIIKDIKNVVNNGINQYRATCGSEKEKKITWIIVQAPKQPGDFECGYYVMRYMKEIIEEPSLLQEKFNNKDVYGEDEINEVRCEWTKYVSTILSRENAITSSKAGEDALQT